MADSEQGRHVGGTAHGQKSQKLARQPGYACHAAGQKHRHIDEAEQRQAANAPAAISTSAGRNGTAERGASMSPLFFPANGFNVRVASPVSPSKLRFSGEPMPSASPMR